MAHKHAERTKVVLWVNSLTMVSLFTIEPFENL